MADLLGGRLVRGALPRSVRVLIVRTPLVTATPFILVQIEFGGRAAVVRRLRAALQHAAGLLQAVVLKITAVCSGWRTGRLLAAGRKTVQPLTARLIAGLLATTLHVVARLVADRVQVLIVDDQGALLCGWHHSKRRTGDTLSISAHDETYRTCITGGRSNLEFVLR